MNERIDRRAGLRVAGSLLTVTAAAAAAPRPPAGPAKDRRGRSVRACLPARDPDGRAAASPITEGSNP